MISFMLVAAAAAFQPPVPSPDPALAFGARENIEFIALSPDGERVVYAVPREGQGSRLLTLDIGSTEPLQVLTINGPDRLAGCNWVSNRRLVCTVFAVGEGFGEIVTASRLVSFDVDGSNQKVLGQRDSFAQLGYRLWGGSIVDWLPGQENQVLMEQMFIPEGRSDTLIKREADGVGVVQVDTANGRTKRVEAAHPNAIRYLSDGNGRIRIMGVRQVRGATGASGQLVTHFYRTADSNEWHDLGTYNVLTGTGRWPLAVEGDSVYLLEEADGRERIQRVALDGSNRSDLVVAHPHVDVDRLIRIGRRNRPVGATYATEKRQSVYFDPELQTVASQLSRSLPDTPLINFVSASDDERKLLVWAGSDVDPGTYYLFDRDQRKLTQLMRSRPELDAVKLASVKPVSYRAADGTEIPAYLTLPAGSDGRNLPTIVMPHGGPGARDEWGFDWLAQYYANRGFAVLQPNFRGSAGYGREWFQINGFQSWATAIGDVNDGGRWLVSEGIADPARLAILGWSYGGYAALQSGVVDPDLFKAIVAIAPVTDLQLARSESRLWANSANIRDFYGTGPHIEQGSPARNAAAIRAPVLLFHGTLDRNVKLEQSRVMRDQLQKAGKAVELLEFDRLDHQLDDSAAREQILRRSDQFLRQALSIR